MDTTAGIERLSEREREVLRLIARGLTNGEIATRLDIRFETAKWHVSEIISKLGVDSREEAAAYWREWHSVGARGRRLVRGLLPVGLVARTGVATAVAGAGVSAAVVVGGLANGTVPLSAEPTLAVTPTLAALTPTPTAPIPSPAATGTWIALRMPERTGPLVDIVSTSLGDRTFTLGLYEADFAQGYSHAAGPGLCLYRRTSFTGAPRNDATWECMGPVTQPHLVAWWGGTARPGTVGGIVPAETIHVRVHLHDGTVLDVDPVPAPQSLNVPWRFWIVAAEDEALFADVEGFDASGAVVASRHLSDPPGSPPPVWSPPPPYEQVNFSVSGRTDPTTGTVGAGLGTRRFTLDGQARELRFRVEHDGNNKPTVVLWCETGVVPLTWDANTQPNGTGSFTASVPEGAKGCDWVAEADGNLRVWAQP